MQDSEKEIGLENTRNAKNVARMQMDVDNGSASGTPAIDTFSLPKPVRIIPIEIEIEKDKVKPNFENEEATLETGNYMSRNSTSTMVISIQMFFYYVFNVLG